MTESIVQRALIACFAVLLAGAAQAATIKVLCDGPLAPALPAVGEAFKKKTGHQVEFAFAPSPVIHKRITDGESADVVIVQPNFLAELAAKGKVDPEIIRPSAGSASGSRRAPTRPRATSRRRRPEAGAQARRYDRVQQRRLRQ